MLTGVLAVAVSQMHSFASTHRPNIQYPKVATSSSSHFIPLAFQQRGTGSVQGSKAQASPAQVHSNNQMLRQSPFKSLAGSSATKVGHSQLSATANASGPDGIGVNFPGFAQPSFFHAGTSSALTYVALTADVNKDGLPDLVTVQSDGTLNISLNPGGGNLGKFAVTYTNTSTVASFPYAVYATSNDLNGDGYPDIEVLDVYNNAIDIYMNKKDGTFADAAVYPVTLNSGGTFYSDGGGAVFGDVTGDGNVDMIVTCFNFDPNFQLPTTTLSVEVFPGNGDGTFADPQPEQDYNFNGQVASSVGQTLLADMNKDGNLDLVIEATGPPPTIPQTAFVSVLKGDGKGAFSGFPTDFPANGVSMTPAENVLGSLYAGDVDGDGDPDVLFAVPDGNLYLALGAGDGSLGAPKPVLTNLFYSGVFNFADVNGDGKLDMVAYNGQYVSVYTGKGDGSFNTLPTPPVATGQTGDEQPMPADFNGDGTLDLVQVDFNTASAGFLLGSNGAFAGAPVLAPSGETPSNFAALAVGDLNGDGLADFIAIDFSEQNAGYIAPIVTALSDGKGGFKYITGVSADMIEALNWQYLYVPPILVDIDRDGKLDLVVATASGIAVVYGNGDGTFGNPVSIPLGVLPNGTDVGDLNGDGLPDIVVTGSGGFYTVLNNGKGNFSVSFTAYGYSPVIPKLVDLNGDKKLDLVLSDVANAFSAGGYQTVQYYYLYTIPGNGDGTFNLGGAQLTLENSAVTSIIPGDFNGDGKQDIVVGVETALDGNDVPIFNTTGTYYMQGNGDFTFQLPIQYTPGLYPIAGGVADFNGDGRPDLALLVSTYNYYTDVTSSQFVYMANLGGGAFGPPMQTFTASSASIDLDAGYVLTGDFNGDGALDVLVNANPDSSGTSAQLYLNTGAVAMNLTANSQNPAQDSSVTLTASVAPVVGTGTPTGTVTFYDNGTALGTEAISNGSAELMLTTLPTGTNAITATYSGDSNFNAAKAATSLTVTVAPLAPAFTLSTPSPASLTLQQGATGTIALTLTGNATFKGAISVTCSGAPSQASCTASPSSTTITGVQTATVSVVFATTTPNNHYSASASFPAWMKASGGLSLAGMLFMILPRRRKRLSSIWTMVLLLCLGVGAAVSLGGCSGGNKYAGTPVGSNTLTVTAASGTITQTATFTVTVTK